MSDTPPGSRNPSPVRVNTPVHRVSRRQRGLPPEAPGQPTDRETMTSSSLVTEGTSSTTPAYCTLENPLTPPTFHGDLHEDVDDWLSEFERVAAFNHWDDDKKLRRVYFSLKDGARTWFQNREDVLTSWCEFQRRLLECYRSADRRERAERELQTRVQMPNEAVTMYVEDMTRLFKRADPTMPEDKKLRHLMRGVKEQLFAGLIRSPPKSVAEFLEEAVTMEKVLRQRSALFDRQVNVAATSESFASLGSGSTEWIREIVRSVVREEIERYCGVRQPVVGSISSVIRDEVQQALHTRQYVPTPTAMPTEVDPVPVTTDIPRRTYAETVGISVPVSRPAAPFHAIPAVTIQSAHAGFDIDGRRAPMRKCDFWRTPDRRPLCYHCGEAGHIYRECRYRQLGLRGFPINSPRPQVGQRPREIEDYLAQQRVSYSPRQSRSPSPRRRSPIRPRFEATAQGRSPSPRREN